jgi:multidrug efflux system outer membrane protein
MSRPTLVALLALLIPACTVGPDYDRPPTPPAEAFQELNPPGASIADLDWWDLFQDTTLQQLIGGALENNRDLRVALARIAEARAVLGFTRADLYPRIDYFAGGAGAASTSSAEDGGETNVSVSGGLSVFWEIDLWGKFRRSNEAALNELLATEESFRGVTITLVADVATAYLQLRDLDNRLVISESTVDARREALDINQARFDAGAIAGVDVAQAEVQLAGAETVVQKTLRARAQTEHAIAVLLGSPPRAIPRGLPLQDQLFPPEIPAGLPSELLERRPDILVAERQLHAQTARIGVAEALKLPSLSLTADAGVKSEELTAVTLTTGLFNLGANLFGPLFNAGRNQQRVEIESPPAAGGRRPGGARSLERSVPRWLDELPGGDHPAALALRRSARRLRDTPASARLDRRSLPGAGRRMVGSPDRDGLRLVPGRRRTRRGVSPRPATLPRLAPRPLPLLRRGLSKSVATSTRWPGRRHRRTAR